jgi:hypothetical protein
MSEQENDDFAINADQLSQIVNFDERMNPEQVKYFNVKYGGIEGISLLLRTDLIKGLEVVPKGKGEEFLNYVVYCILYMKLMKFGYNFS